MIERTSEFQCLEPDGPTNTIERLVVENENLRRKLQTLPVIEQAKGILMGHYGIPADDAFEMLRRFSQDTNTKLHLVAQTIINRRCPAEASDGQTLRDPAWTPRHSVSDSARTSAGSVCRPTGALSEAFLER